MTSEGRVFARWPQSSRRRTTSELDATPLTPYQPWQGPTVMPESVTDWVAAQQGAKLIRWLKDKRLEGFRDAYYDASTHHVVIIWEQINPAQSQRVKQIATNEFFIGVDDMVPAPGSGHGRANGEGSAA